MTIILQIVQTQSPVFFKSLRRCSRELGPVGDLVNLEFSYRRVFIGEKVIRDLDNRGLGPVGELGLGLQSGTWACRGIGSIGDLVIGEFCYRGLGQSGTWAIGLTSCSLQNHGKTSNSSDKLQGPSPLRPGSEEFFVLPFPL